MYVITGITGRVGGHVARALRSGKLPVRGVMRDQAKASAWVARGCEVAIAETTDTAALIKAFKGAEGVFVMLPSVRDPQPGFAEALPMVAALRTALDATRPERIVCLSTIGVQVKQPNLLNKLRILEEALNTLSIPIAFLRAAWFMENARSDIASARDRGVIASFLQPLDKPVPMVATSDVGRVAAELMQERWRGRRIVDLEGPRRVTPHDLAATFAKLFARPVRAEPVPRETWEGRFIAQGMKNPTPRIQMLDGFNEGWIEFEDGEAGARKGGVSLEASLKSLIERL
ncbi:NAD-dependent epimerase/dehydratase family protein [Dyella dinghuensis]|uniref:NAD-dependent epimerase/dehydratase family protein n=2 Tax=Dyella dinghuensis TaxID=1920169 RepID=A0A432LWD8_9GAMM|nr:NAD-dependent epimerase/dehydratase family protein [Dyella dinghuensis]